MTFSAPNQMGKVCSPVLLQDSTLYIKKERKVKEKERNTPRVIWQLQWPKWQLPLNMKTLGIPLKVLHLSFHLKCLQWTCDKHYYLSFKDQHDWETKQCNGLPSITGYGEYRVQNSNQVPTPAMHSDYCKKQKHYIACS